MAQNITEELIEFIALDNYLISLVDDQGFLCHLELMNPRHALPSLHYITLTQLLSYNMPVCTLSTTTKTGNRGDAERM